MDNKMVIGSAEWCAFPGLNIPAVKARVDSGAKTSSLHALNIQPFRRNGERWVSFDVHPLQNSRHPVIRCESKVVDKRRIKSSSGDIESRYVISTILDFAGESHIARVIRRGGPAINSEAFHKSSPVRGGGPAKGWWRGTVKFSILDLQISTNR